MQVRPPHHLPSTVSIHSAFLLGRGLAAWLHPKTPEKGYVGGGQGGFQISRVMERLKAANAGRDRLKPELPALSAINHGSPADAKGKTSQFCASHRGEGRNNKPLGLTPHKA